MCIFLMSKSILLFCLSTFTSGFPNAKTTSSGININYHNKMLLSILIYSISSMLYSIMVNSMHL